MPIAARDIRAGGSPLRAWTLVLALLGALAAAPVVPAQIEPGLQILAEPAEVDFGDVAPGASVTRTVSLKNEGRFSVRIRSLRPSCECTVVELPFNTEIPPGGSLDLPITFSATTREGPTRPNVVVVFAERIPPLRIEGRANVNRGIRFETRKAIGPRGEGVEVARLVSVDGRPFRVLSVNGRPPRTLQDVEGVTEASLAHEVSISAPATPGIFPGDDRWVAIETDDPKAPVVVVPAPGAERPAGARSWTISDPLRVLGRMTPGEDETIEVFLTGVRGTALRAIERIEADQRGAEAWLMGIEPAPAGMAARFAVRPVEDAPGVVAVTLRITARGHTETLDVYGAAPP